MTKTDAQTIKDAVLAYAATDEVENEAEYDILYSFGIWCADQAGAGDVVLSDWTPRRKV